MASINYILLIAAVVILPVVENAPSNIVKTKSIKEELQSKLIFIDRDIDNSDNSPLTDYIHVSSTPVYPKARSKYFAKSVQNVPVLEVKVVEPSELSGMDDDRRIWGIAVENKDLIEDESFYNRPLALPKNIVKIPDQAPKRVISEVLKVTGSPKPSACDIAILICCENPSKSKECFKSQGCLNVTEGVISNVCNVDNITKTIENLGKYYRGDQGK